MKKFNGVKILFESQREIGDNPLDFLSVNHIQNGLFVSLGYLKEEKLSKSRRYVNADNDAKLGEVIAKAGDSRFGRDFAAVRSGAKYQKALAGEAKTGEFELGDVHILKLGRYNFQWKNAARKRQDYEERELPAEHAIRSHYGFATFDADNNFEEGDWHIKRKVGRNGQEKYVYGGPSVYPEVADQDADKGMGWRPIGGEGADFFEHENTHNITFRQVLGKNAMRQYQFYYVQEADGILEPLDKDAFYTLANEFSRKEVAEVCDDLLDIERAFIADMEELSKRYNHRTFNWENVLYLTASTAGYDADDKVVYEPFIWINDKAILRSFPWLDEKSLSDLIDNSVRISKKDLEEWRKTPDIWESKQQDFAKKLYESITASVNKAIKDALRNEK